MEVVKLVNAKARIGRRSWATEGGNSKIVLNNIYRTQNAEMN